MTEVGSVTDRKYSRFLKSNLCYDSFTSLHPNFYLRMLLGSKDDSMDL